MTWLTPRMRLSSGVHWREFFLNCPAHQRAQPNDLTRGHSVETGPTRLRLDNDLVVATVGEINLDCAKARNVEFDILRMEVAGNIEAPNLVDERPAPDILDIDFASRRIDRKLPSTLGTTRPSSIATVTVPIVPWPHIGRQPLTSMKRTPTSQSSRDEGYGIVRT